jgi:hypothetical protein
LLIIVSPLAAQATQSGLKVIVYVYNVPGYVFGQEAGITVTSEGDMEVYRGVEVPVSDSFFVKMQFGRGDVAVGEGVSGCVYINEQLNECGWATNSDDMR